MTDGHGDLYPRSAWVDGYCDGLWDAASIVGGMIQSGVWTPEQVAALQAAYDDLADMSAK